MIALVCVIVIQGCASMSGEECQTADWYTIGYEDGLKGRAEARLGDHRKACAKHGVTLDLASYREGRYAGLDEYCQPSNGFRVGTSGGRYAGACPAELEGEFQLAYQDGLRIYRTRSRVRKLEQRLRHWEQEHAETEAAIAATERELIGLSTTIERRVQLLVDLRDLEAALADADRNIHDIQHQLSSERSHLVSLRENSAW